MKATYTAVLIPSTAGGCVVEVPALPGCLTEGDTLEEALEMAPDAMRGYLAVLQEDGDVFPRDRREVTVALGRKREALLRKVTVTLPEEVARVAY
jgi:predicted RNase H-like HicB family nuclease